MQKDGEIQAKAGQACLGAATGREPGAPDGSPFLLCGTHNKYAEKHVKAYKERLHLEKLLRQVAQGKGGGGGNDNNTPAVFPAAVAAKGQKKDDDDDEMTEEEVRLHRGSSSPALAKKESDKTKDNGGSAERVVDIVKIDNKFYVCNVPGSSEDHAKWKPFWEKHTGRKQPASCQIKDCVKKVKATGHMYWRDDEDDKTYNYLVPICSHHNSEVYDWKDKETKWQPCKAGLAVKIKESPKTAAHAYNLRERKPKK